MTAIFPSGARVLLDGRDPAIVRQAFPQGSTSYLFPHYKVDVVNGDTGVAVAMDRVGVTPAPAPKKLTLGKGMNVRLTKAGEAAEARFDALVVAYLTSIGAVKENYGPLTRWKVETTLGPLHVAPYGHWIACVFDDHLGAVNATGCNPYSGKWNHHYDVGAAEAEVADFARRLGRFLPAVQP